MRSSDLCPRLTSIRNIMRQLGKLKVVSIPKAGCQSQGSAIGSAKFTIPHSAGPGMSPKMTRGIRVEGQR